MKVKEFSREVTRLHNCGGGIVDAPGYQPEDFVYDKKGREVAGVFSALSALAELAAISIPDVTISAWYKLEAKTPPEVVALDRKQSKRMGTHLHRGFYRSYTDLQQWVGHVSEVSTLVVRVMVATRPLTPDELLLLIRYVLSPESIVDVPLDPHQFKLAALPHQDGGWVYAVMSAHTGGLCPGRIILLLLKEQLGVRNAYTRELESTIEAGGRHLKGVLSPFHQEWYAAYITEARRELAAEDARRAEAEGVLYSALTRSLNA